ncbi:MAG TPA: fumarate hydratase [Archaeoglobaceae archaeon]|nr:fumarate hydratase [Archaeoglobaceae archaeon]
MSDIKIRTPFEKRDILVLRVGDAVSITGEIITARDKAHQRILKYIEEGRELPFDLNNSIMYHCGPLMRKKNGWEVISAGPTTSARMNESTVKILRIVDSIAIAGKGGMNLEVAENLKGKGVYLAVTGGTGALSTRSVKKVKACFWEDLGMVEAVWIFEVEDFPCIVGIDSRGESLYDSVEKKAELNFNKIKY